MSRKIIIQCIYCGSDKELTKDHIPPRSLFVSPYPNNLATVPSCRKCNLNFSKDDEYLMTILNLRKDVKGHPYNKDITNKIERIMVKENKRKYSKMIYEKINFKDIISKGGIYLGKEPAIELDLPRLESIISRITKGLFFLTKKVRIPADYLVESIQAPSLNNLVGVGREYYLNLFWSLYKSKSYDIGENVFSYRYNILDDDDVSSYWMMIFYNKVHFFSRIRKNN